LSGGDATRSTQGPISRFFVTGPHEYGAGMAAIVVRHLAPKAAADRERPGARRLLFSGQSPLGLRSKGGSVQDAMNVHFQIVGPLAEGGDAAAYRAGKLVSLVVVHVDHPPRDGA
jgi:hypothetical protein